MNNAALSQASIDHALQTCASEPIHVPAAIQPEGMLVVLSAKEHLVLQMSANSLAWLGMKTEFVLNRPLALINPHIAQALVHAELQLSGSPREIPVAFTSPSGQSMAVLAHRVGERVILEFLPTDPPTALPRSTDVIDGLLREYTNSVGSTDAIALAQPIADAIASMSGYSRVMIYRFDSEGDGEVIAEHVAPGMESFLGLKYPASDIPTQARAILLLNRIRVIADSSHAPVPLITVSGEGAARIDLTMTSLRAVSPVHLEYLRNMGVTASLSASIIVNRKLWGLVACHHHHVRGASLWLRSQIDLVASLYATRLAEAHGRRQLDAQLRADQLQRAILKHLTREDSVNWASQLIADPSFLTLVQASGAIIQFDGHRISAGKVPSDQVVDSILAWLGKQPSEAMVVCESIPRGIEMELSERALCSGLLSMSLESGGHIIWIRPEMVTEITWGGDPRKVLESGSPTGRLSPRTSFSAWVETVRGRSRAWSVEDLAAAMALNQHLSHVVTHVYGVKEALARSNRELRDFAHTVSHDLREPCRTIRMSCELALIHGGDQIPKIAHRLQRAMVIAERMQRLITDLLNFAEVERTAEIGEIVNVRDAVDDALVALEAATAEATAVITIADLPMVAGSRAQLTRLFQNLIGNALKYRREVSPVIHISASRLPGFWCLCVRDNGIGVPKEYHERIFGIFKRAHASSHQTGSGVGLALCSRIAEMHGGNIWVESEPDSGSTFYITIADHSTGDDGQGEHV